MSQVVCIKPYIMSLTHFDLSSGGLHRSWNVCPPREKGARHPGGFRDGRGKGDEEGYREEHVAAEAMEVRPSF